MGNTSLPPRIALWLCKAYGCAKGMDFFLLQEEEMSSPLAGEEQEANLSLLFFFFLCNTSHDCVCCLTQGFWTLRLGQAAVPLLILSGKFKCFGGNTVPSSDGGPAKAPHCSCSNMFFWKG